MKKILYIATTADRRDRLDGETIKCRLLREYLENIDDIKVFCVDTDNWKKHVLKLVFEIIYYFIMCDEIIVSSADRGANIVPGSRKDCGSYTTSPWAKQICKS